MGRRRQERVFYLAWNHNNHEMALGMLWIRLLSNLCIFWFRYTSLIVLFFGKNYLMFMTLKSFRLCSFPLFKYKFSFCPPHKKCKCQKVWVHFESPNPQTLIGFYTWPDLTWNGPVWCHHEGYILWSRIPRYKPLKGISKEISSFYLACLLLLPTCSKSTKFLAILYTEHLGTWHTVSNLWEDCGELIFGKVYLHFNISFSYKWFEMNSLLIKETK